MGFSKQGAPVVQKPLVSDDMDDMSRKASYCDSIEIIDDGSVELDGEENEEER